MTHISIYKNAKDSTSSETMEFLTVLSHIKNGTLDNKDVILLLRKETDKKKRADLKKKLKAFTFSGAFTKRNADSLKSYSYLICIDIDDLEDAQGIKNSLISNDYYLHAAFISPSGNGLKLIYKTETQPAQHKDLFESISNYLHEYFNLTADPSGKDICRLCFISYDPILYHAHDAGVLDDTFIKKYFPIEQNDKISKPQPQPKPQSKSLPKDPAEIIHNTVIKTVHPADGQYNAYINNFAIQANRWGLSVEQTADQICRFCGWAQPNKDDFAVIKSVYAKFSHEFDQYHNEKKKRENALPPPAKKSPVIDAPSSPYNEDIQFWYKVEKFDKSSGEIIEGKEDYKFSYDDAIIFLENNGFFKLKSGEAYNFIHVNEDSKIVSLTPVLRIKEFFIDYLKSKDSIEFKRVREMFRRGAKNYCSLNLLEGLEYHSPIFKRDTATSAFVYFKNSWCEITKDGISTYDYDSQEGYIWERQILDIDFKQVDYSTCDANRFIMYASSGKKLEIKDYSPEEIQKYNSMRSTIGYLLHAYKSPIVTKAVISVDKKLRVGAEDNGGSGKSLFIQLISRMAKTCRIDAKNFKFDAAFPFQKVDIDTRIIDFDDVRPQFDFTRLFSMITSEFSYEKKGIPLITIPFEDSPKFYISTNKSIKSEGVSTTRRQHVIEFSTFFNEYNTVAMEFKRMFFFDWDQDEWQRYYSFMIDCIHLYLKEGLIPFPLENYGLNKLIDTAGEEFVEYLDDTVLAQLKYGHREFDSTKLFDSYIEIAKPKYGLKKNTFTKWVRMWSDLNDLIINAHKDDGRDRRNGTDYWTFTKKQGEAFSEAPQVTNTEFNYSPENDEL